MSNRRDSELELIEGNPSESIMSEISRGLLSHHAKSGHPRAEEVFHIVHRDEADAVRGGVVCSLLWGRMYIRSLWVDESLRGKGIGRKLMEMAEAEALKRGCTHAHTDTFSWQAPEFYKALGYEVYGVLENYPEGCSLTYVTKKLA